MRPAPQMDVEQSRAGAADPRPGSLSGITSDTLFILLLHAFSGGSGGQEGRGKGREESQE